MTRFHCKAAASCSGRQIPGCAAQGKALRGNTGYSVSVGGFVHVDQVPRP